MDILTRHISYEETIKGSRFLSELIPCESQAEARELIKAQKAKYADSTHVVHAFIVGAGAEVKGMSDDGEPSGTAGRPTLDVLNGRGCTNALLTITRWFGGTLLGTGGLVKAYSGGAKGVIQAADAEGAFQPLVEKKAFTFQTDYSLLKPIKNLMASGSFHFWNVKEDFGTEVTLSGEIQADEHDIFASKLKDLSNGKITL